MKIQIKAKPNSKKQKIEKLEGDSLLVHLKSSPIKDKANQKLIKALAKKDKVTQSRVSIKHGLLSKIS